MKWVPIAAGLLATMIVDRGAQAQSCTASSSGIAFGNYSTLAESETDTAGTITVSCSSAGAAAVGYTLQLGTGGSGSYAARSLAGNGRALAYQLYTDSLHTVIWGDGITAGTGTVSDSYTLSGTTANRNYAIYGIVSARQSVTAGSYTDVIQIIVTY
jgi:spore coat protein U-like protein